jgi:hypothetical protein
MLRRWFQRRRLLKARVAEARRQQVDPWDRHASSPPNLLHDPIEDDPKMELNFRQADALTERALMNYRNKGMGFCNVEWKTKQRTLKEQFGITWFTLSDMNPYMIFD